MFQIINWLGTILWNELDNTSRLLTIDCRRQCSNVISPATRRLDLNGLRISLKSLANYLEKLCGSWEQGGSFNSNEIKARSNTFFRTFVRPRAKNLPLFPTRSSKKGRHEFFIKLEIRMPDARVFQGENSLDTGGEGERRRAKWYLKFRYTCGYPETFLPFLTTEKLPSFVDLPGRTPNFLRFSFIQSLPTIDYTPFDYSTRILMYIEKLKNNLPK